VEPDASPEINVIAGAVQLSVADIDPYVTTAEQRFGAVLTVTLLGQVIDGGVLSIFVNDQIVQPVAATPWAFLGNTCQ
jgi:hypothetical protein